VPSNGRSAADQWVDSDYLSGHAVVQPFTLIGPPTRRGPALTTPGLVGSPVVP